MLLQQSFLLERKQWRERLYEELVEKLVYAQVSSTGALEELARMLGVDLYRPRVAAYIEYRSIGQKAGGADGQLGLLAGLKTRLDRNDLVSFHSPQSLVVLKCVRVVQGQWNEDQVTAELLQMAEELATARGLCCTVSIGPYEPGLSGISLSFRQSKKTMEAGKKLFPGAKCYRYRDSEAQRDLAGLYGRIAEADKRGELEETLRLYIEEGGELNRTAEKLFIHRNTLRYRLDKIKELTGKDPKKIKNLLELYASMILYQFHS